MTERPGADRPGGAGAVTGVVLCGGRSERMGADKALAELGGVRLVERAVRCLAPVAERVVLACGPTPRYAELGLERVLDRAPGGGPLCGLEAALAAASTEWVAALACDMPRVTPRVFEALLARAAARGLDACLLAGPRGVEPLCAVYRATCLEAVRAALDAGEHKVVAFHGRSVRAGGAPRALRVEGLALEGADALNLNSPADLERERARLVAGAALEGAAGGAR